MQFNRKTMQDLEFSDSFFYQPSQATALPYSSFEHIRKGYRLPCGIQPFPEPSAWQVEGWWNCSSICPEWHLCAVNNLHKCPCGSQNPYVSFSTSVLPPRTEL